MAVNTLPPRVTPKYFTDFHIPHTQKFTSWSTFKRLVIANESTKYLCYQSRFFYLTIGCKPVQCFRKQTSTHLYGLFFIALSLALFVISTAEADSFQVRTLSLHSEVSKQPANPYIRILEDKDNRFTINDILQANRQDDFVSPKNPSTLNLGYSRSSFWIKLTVKNESIEDTFEWWYQLDLPLLEQSEFYLVSSDGGIQTPAISKSMYYDTPLKDRDVNHITQVYRFSLDQGEKATIYLKINNDFSIHLPLYIYTPEGFSNSVAVEELLYGGFIGSLLILIAYNLFMFISVKESTFLYYILYMASYLIFLLTERVHGLSILGEIPNFFHKDNLSFYIWITWLFALALARSFLETKEHEPDLDAIIKLFIALATISIVVSPLIPSTITIQWAVFGTIPYAILMVWIAYIAMVRGNTVAHFYFTAWFLNFGGVVVYALTVTGHLPFNFITSNSPHFGIICQMVIISFALADRIKVAQRRAASATQQSLLHLNRYQSLFTNAVEGIFQISLNREFIDANPAMAKMLGYDSPNSLIKHVQDALHICYPIEKDLSTVINQVEQGKDIHELEARYTGLDGQTRWATSTVRIIYGHDHNPTHLEGTFIDITERVERLNDRLKKDVAEASAAAKSRFLANMSHEIRTPLTAIIGYGESLLDETLSDKEKRESSEIVIQSGKHLLELVNDILDHSKIDADKMSTEKITVKLLPIFDEIKTYFAPKAAEKRIDFNIQYEFPLPQEIETDPTRLKQILINLCANALKFTDSGSISMTVRCDKPAEQLFIKITDTGVGVRKEQLEKLFDPFAQAAPSVARQHGGTGLGLSISKRLAEMLGGTVTVLSVFGEGSQFEVSLSTGPLEHIKSLQNKSELNQQKHKLTEIEIPNLRGRVLYAEDNELNCKLVESLINKTGAAITLVNNGAKALELVTRSDEHFDLILMDIQMPVMNGRDATKAIREAGINTPIVAFSANVMAQDVAEYKEAGCTDFMPKPIQKLPFYSMLSLYLPENRRSESDTRINDKPASLVVPQKIKKNKLAPLSGTVLVAEDNVVNSRLISLFLTKVGVKIILANNGEQAIQEASHKQIDLILMDQHMPMVDGPEATMQLRKMGFECPILAFTASNDSDDRSVMINAGCNGSVDKPINLEQLYQTLCQYLPIATESTKENSNSKQEPLMRQFVHELPSLTLLMSQALEEHDWVSLQSLAHEIMGAAGSLGFKEITASAKRVENALQKDNLKNIKKLFNTFKHDIHKAEADLKRN